MANDNETVAEIVKRVRRECNSYPLPANAAEMLRLVREIKTVHDREIAAKDAEIRRLKLAILANKARKTKAYGEARIKAKDAEIAELREYLRKAIMKECSLLVECADCRAKNYCDMQRWRKALEGAK